MDAPASKGTLTRLFYDAVERHGHKDKAVACKPAGGAWRSLTHRELEERVRRAGLGLAAARRAARRPRGDPLGEPARLAGRGLRLPGGRRERRAALSHAPRPPDRLHPEGLGRGGDLRLDRAAARQDPGDPRGAAGPQDHHRHGPGCEGTGRDRAGGPLRHRRRGRGGGRRRALQGRGADGRARRRRHHHLHLGHHRRPQGRDAHARQHLVERDERPRVVLGRPDGLDAELPAAVAHLRADGRALSDVPRRRHDPLRREHRHRAREPGRGRADHGDLGAAPVREDVRPGPGERAGRRPDQEADLLLGEGRGRAVGRPPAGRRGSRRRS